MIEGKTKMLTPLWRGASIGLVTTKNDITAGDGAKHDVMVGKAELATRTTCNVFDYLASHNISLAYVGRDGPTTFLTRICKMIPVEVVVRKIATGSYLKRYPDALEGTVFDIPKVEFFLKTVGRQFEGMTLPCDDPLMAPGEIGWDLYLPNKPESEGFIGLLSLPEGDIEVLFSRLKECATIARKVFRLLELAWQSLDGLLYDFKLEFGVLPDGSLVVADVIDSDSWRVIWGGYKLSKQGYRDGDDLDIVLGNYRLAASLTGRMVRS